MALFQTKRLVDNTETTGLKNIFIVEEGVRQHGKSKNNSINLVLTDYRKSMTSYTFQMSLKLNIEISGEFKGYNQLRFKYNLYNEICCYF